MVIDSSGLRPLGFDRQVRTTQIYIRFTSGHVSIILEHSLGILRTFPASNVVPLVLWSYKHQAAPERLAIFRAGYNTQHPATKCARIHESDNVLEIDTPTNCETAVSPEFHCVSFHTM
jgi:hypothetical protein